MNQKAVQITPFSPNVESSKYVLHCELMLVFEHDFHGIQVDPTALSGHSATLTKTVTLKLASDIT